MMTATQSAHERKLSARLRKAADQGLSAALDAKKRSSTACHFEEALRTKIVGQDEAVQALVDLYQVFCAGLHSPGRRSGDFVRRQSSGNQGGLRGIPALPRNCEIDWFAAGISGAPRDAPADNARSVGRKPRRSLETEFSAVRR